MSRLDVGAALIDRAACRLHPSLPLDPYLVWGLLTDFSGTAVAGQPAEQVRLPMLVELNAVGARDRDAFGEAYRVPALYQSTVNARGDLGRFVSCSVPLTQLDALLHDPCVKRAELSLCRLAGWPAREAARPEAIKPLQIKGMAESTPRVVLGVIDDGFAFLHRGLLPRMGYLWDQNPPGAAVAEPGYGSELTPAHFAALRQSAGDEDTTYELLAMGWNGQRYQPQRSHGTAMLGAALGLAPSQDDAPELPCVAVQLPEATLADTSGGALAAGLLDGLRYVLDRAKRLNPHGPKVLVNISLGIQAGPHDGSSMLERALAELVSLHGNLGLMLAAGNCRRDDGHVQFLLPRKTPQRLRLRVLADATRHGFVELWLPKGMPLASVQLSLNLPGGDRMTVTAGRYSVDPQQRAWLIFPEHTALAEERTLALLVIAPMSATPGEWSLELQHDDEQAWDCHAWIHRDDQIYRRRSPQGLRFADDGSGLVQQLGTLNGIACGEAARPGRAPSPDDWASLSVVGAYRSSDGAVAAYSSLGRTLGSRQGPDLLLAADLGASTPGRPCLGTHSNVSQRAGGTSLASALATARQLSLLMDPFPWRAADTDLKALATQDEVVAAGKWANRPAPEEGHRRVMDGADSAGSVLGQ